MKHKPIACTLSAIGIVVLSWSAVPQSLNRGEAAHLAKVELGADTTSSLHGQAAMTEEEQLMQGAQAWLEAIGPKTRR
jgi:hypothetical protein